MPQGTTKSCHERKSSCKTSITDCPSEWVGQTCHRKASNHSTQIAVIPHTHQGHLPDQFLMDSVYHEIPGNESRGFIAFSPTLLIFPPLRLSLPSHSEHLWGWKRSLKVIFSAQFGLAYLWNRYTHSDLNVFSIVGLYPICSISSTVLRPFLYSGLMELCASLASQVHMSISALCFLPWNSTGIILSPAPGCYKRLCALGALLSTAEADTLLKRISAALSHHF